MLNNGIHSACSTGNISFSVFPNIPNISICLQPCCCSLCTAENLQEQAFSPCFSLFLGSAYQLCSEMKLFPPNTLEQQVCVPKKYKTISLGVEGNVTYTVKGTNNGWRGGKYSLCYLNIQVSNLSSGKYLHSKGHQ